MDQVGGIVPNDLKFSERFKLKSPEKINASLDRLKQVGQMLLF